MSVRYLSVEQLLHTARRTLGTVEIRDLGLLESAVARPRTTVFGQDAYPDLLAKAAALVHSIARNHALVDGNKRLALTGLIVFLGINGQRLNWTNDEAYDAIMAVADGSLDSIEAIRERLVDGVGEFDY